MKAWPALISGVLFGLGLTLSGMSDPAKVLGFLNITGRGYRSDLRHGRRCGRHLTGHTARHSKGSTLAGIDFFLPGSSFWTGVWLAAPCYLASAGDYPATARDLPW